MSLPTIRFASDASAAEHHVATDDPRSENIAWRIGAAPDVIAGAGTVQASRPESNEIDVELNLERGGTVLVAEQCSTGWRAALDGQSVPLEHQGIRPAIDRFMSHNKQWRIFMRFVESHGLLVLSRDR